MKRLETQEDDQPYVQHVGTHARSQNINLHGQKMRSKGATGPKLNLVSQDNHPTFNPGSERSNIYIEDDESGAVELESLNLHQKSMSCIPFQKLDTEDNQVKVKVEGKHHNFTNE